MKPILPPGTILQHMYLLERLSPLKPGQFIEIGPGAGDITALLIELGWRGTCYDLNAETTEKLGLRFQDEIEEGTLKIVNDDFLKSTNHHNDKVELLISCMVLEHLDETEETQFIKQAENSLSSNGRIITLVPGSPKHWGIEDDIAGHYRRYTKETIDAMILKSGMELQHLSGLTFPVSNCLLPISNFLVKHQEAGKVNLSMQERTKKSGIRSVFMKTNFPKAAKLLLNPIVMFPFHLLQKAFSQSSSALVLYFEATPKGQKNER